MKVNLSSISRAAPPLAVFVIMLGLWDTAVRILAIPRYLLPGPADVLLAAFQDS
jgi:ABC-type nitrate/sulfonate/bicarbonate transport system permease component